MRNRIAVRGAMWLLSKLGGLDEDTISRAQTSLTRLDFCLVGFLYVAMFAGRFSFDRFLDEGSRIPLLELRFWFLVAACVVLWRRRTQYLHSRPHRPGMLLLLVGSVLLLHSYMFVHAVALGVTDYRNQSLVDVAHTSVLLVLIPQAILNARDLRVFALVSEMAGVGLFLLAAAGIGNPELNGHGWAPFGGPITFYRLEFLGFCAALYLAWCIKDRLLTTIHLSLAATCLFGTLASLSKAAFLGAILCTLFALSWMLACKSWPRAIATAIVVLVGFVSFALVKGTVLAARVAAVSDSTVVGVSNMLPSDAQPSFTNKQLDNSKNKGRVVALEDLPIEQQNRVRGLWEIYQHRVPDLDYRRNLEGFLKYTTRVSIVDDSTYRVPLILHAFQLFRDNKLLGVGVGNYAYFAPNIYTWQIEQYRYPHNIVFELLSVQGLAGFGLWSAALFLALVAILSAMSVRTDALLFFTYLLFVFFTAQLSGDYYDFRAFWFVLVAIVSSVRLSEQPT